MKKQKDSEELERLEAVYGKAVWEEVLKAPPRSGGQPELAAELDGGCQLSKQGLQNSSRAIL